MKKLTVHGQRVETIFELLGNNENAMTYSLGWALAKSDSFCCAFAELLKLDSSFTDNMHIRLQEYNQEKGYQLIAAKDDDRVVFLINKSADLLSKDEQYNTLEVSGTERFSFDDSSYIVATYSKRHAPISLEDLVKTSSAMNAQELLSIANAISEMAASFPDAIWNSALYLPGEKICLATEFSKKSNAKIKYALAVRLLVGFIPDTNISAKTIHRLNPDLTLNDIRNFLEIIGFEDDQLYSKLSGAKITSPEKFKLPGRPDLEKFFQEDILDYFYRYNDYQAMGIQPPNGILFYGPPGTGKTHTAKAISDFLKWPIYEIDIGGIGRPCRALFSPTLQQNF